MYDIIVVGGGHAGVEAALVSARRGYNTLLVTSNINNIASMPCNPSIGGSAKGIVVRELDALGGQMGKTADDSILQLKMLNNSKGIAVRSLRSQADKKSYPQKMLITLKNTKNLTIKEAMVEDLIIDNDTIKGIVLENLEKIESKIVILTTGTYLKADILVGEKRHRSGPNNEKSSNFLSDNLKKLGFEIQRLKTGTPPRIKKDSINYAETKIEYGDDVSYTFSFDNEVKYDVKNQLPCHLIYTTPLTHQLINENLTKSSMYGGYVTGVGPRYCPSIEDKIIRFSDKPRHQLFLEPESLYTDDIYMQGFSTSMPYDVQDKMIRSIPALANCIINKYAYAIEYDAISPIQLCPSLETKIIKGLFTAGQINGTSGYEEAACQGLMAGINATLKLENKDPLILKRSEAYIGVLIDDLVTKGTKEPYRLLTSRAEYRLLLRHDNADRRLSEYGYKLGLLTEERYQKFRKKYSDVELLKEELKNNKLYPTIVTNEFLTSINSANIKDGISLYEILKRPEITLDILNNFMSFNYSNEVKEIAQIDIKYAGYIKKVYDEIAKNDGLEKRLIPSEINYHEISNLALEARDKLSKIRPINIAQASRISGVNPSDISILLLYLKKNNL